MTSHHQPSNVVKFPPIGECDVRDCSYEPNYAAVDPRPNLFDQLAAENLQRERVGRFGFANRATRQSPSQSALSRLFERVSAIAWGDVLFGAACGLLVGMIATVGLAYVWSPFL